MISCIDNLIPDAPHVIKVILSDIIFVKWFMGVNALDVLFSVGLKL